MDHLPSFNPRILLWIFCLALLYTPINFAQTINNHPATVNSIEKEDTQALEQRIQNIKKEVSRLNRDLFILEEELLFPANTQIVVFISLSDGNLFKLDGVELKINDKLIASHLYTDREVSSLQKGGVQRLYIGNLPTGKHELVAFFTGQGPNNIDYRRGTTLNFEKGLTSKYIELKIADNPAKQQPEFLLKEW